MDNEIDILTDIYADVINHIEYVKTSRKRIMNINNSIQFVDNNYFDIICNDELLKRYLNVFDNVKECNEVICDL